MEPAKLPNNENTRLAVLQGTNLLDSPAESSFDALTNAAAKLCNTPLSFVCLVDSERVWFKSKQGLENVEEIPRDIGFCPHTINQKNFFEVQDALFDKRFSNSPMVINEPNLRYYAGFPLITKDGFALGTLCVMDYKPRQLDEIEQEALKGLAKTATALIESKRLKQMRLMSLEHRLGDIIEISPNEVYLVDSKTEKFTYANRTALYNLGHNLNHLKQLHWYDVITHTPDSIITNKILSLQTTRSTPMHLQTSQRRHDGSEYPVDCIFQRCCNEDNEFLIISNDISQRKQAEEKTKALMDNLPHVTRLNTLNVLASGLAHELNQPLTAMSQYCSTALYIAENELEENAVLIESIEKTNTQLDRAAEIIRRFRAFSGKRQTTRSKINAQELINEALSLTNQDIIKNSIILTIKAQENLPDFYADPVQIQQVLLNLITNSIQAMEHQHDSKKIILSCIASEPGEIEFTIADTGPGIKDIELENLTTPTPSEKPNGTGLGLSVCKFIVDAHKGKLWHDKNYTDGTSIVFELATTLESD